MTRLHLAWAGSEAVLSSPFAAAAVVSWVLTVLKCRHAVAPASEFTTMNQGSFSCTAVVKEIIHARDVDTLARAFRSSQWFVRAAQ